MYPQKLQLFKPYQTKWIKIQTNEPFPKPYIINGDNQQFKLIDLDKLDRKNKVMGLFRNKSAEVRFAYPNIPIAKIQEVEETDEIFPEDFQINFCQKIQKYQNELEDFEKSIR